MSTFYQQSLEAYADLLGQQCVELHAALQDLAFAVLETPEALAPATQEHLRISLRHALAVLDRREPLPRGGAMLSTCLECGVEWYGSWPLERCPTCTQVWREWYAETVVRRLRRDLAGATAQSDAPAAGAGTATHTVPAT